MLTNFLEPIFGQTIYGLLVSTCKTVARQLNLPERELNWVGNWSKVAHTY